MKWVWACIVVIFLCLPIFSLAANPNDPNPSLSSSISGTNVQPYADLPGEVAKALISMEDRLADDFHTFNDENFGLFDAQIKSYMAQYQKKVIIGIMGAAFLIFGLIFYVIAQNNKKISFESSEVRRREKETERQYIVDSLNYIRERVDELENQAKQDVDLSVIPFEDIDKEYYRRRSSQINDEKSAFDRQVDEFVNKHGGVSYGEPAVSLEEGGWQEANSGANYEQSAYGGAQDKGRTPETRYV